MVTPELCRAARGLLDWSQDDLAKAAGVARQTVVDFERGERSPRKGNMKALQEALKTGGVAFVISTDGRPAVSLRSRVWKLIPVDSTSRNWDASTYRGELIVRADSERRAREIATLTLSIATSRKLGEPLATNPWNRIVGEVKCERILDAEFSEDGPEAILYPAIHNREWESVSGRMAG